MELVLRQPNLDFPAEEHLFFHVGNGNFIAYFVPGGEATHQRRGPRAHSTVRQLSGLRTSLSRRGSLGAWVSRSSPFSPLPPVGGGRWRLVSRYSS
jgi:hypothetical protein